MSFYTILWYIEAGKADFSTQINLKPLPFDLFHTTTTAQERLSTFQTQTRVLNRATNGGRLLETS